MKRLSFLLVYALVCSAQATPRPVDEEPTLLEIHYINVGQGGATLIKTPNGRVILYDFGNYRAEKDLIPYLKQADVLGDKRKIDYAILSHNDRDHYTGYLGLIEAGYDVVVANYSSGADESNNPLLYTQWLSPAKRTTAGQVVPIAVGDAISLGDGSELIVAAANGRVMGRDTQVESHNKNDASISLLLRYKNFHYVLDGDLGSGPETCTEHQTEQANIQVLVAEALLEQGYLDSDYGVDVMHVAHHGSESSTSSTYYNLMQPTVGVISVGIRNKKYRHPREDVVERVLLDNTATPRSPCVADTPPLEYLLQTEDGSTESGRSSTGRTSNAGLASGDILIQTDGTAYYDIHGSNRVHENSRREFPEGIFIRCEMDELAKADATKCTEIVIP